MTELFGVIDLDASTLGERFTSLNLSVVTGGVLFQWPGYHPSQTKGKLASSLGGTVGSSSSSGAAELEGDRDGRPGALCRLALDGDPEPGMASAAARQPADGVSGRRRSRLRRHWQAGAATRSRVEGERSME